MPEFAFIFRPTRPIAPSDLPRRNAAARDWALALQRDGKLHGANPLGDDGFKVSDTGVAPTSREGAVASVLIIEAESLESAVALAKGHPGLAFGTEIEVRPVKAVAPPSPGGASR
jgi:YCII-related domain-containing protein